MLGEQAIIPNFTSYPNPNPNPLPSLTDASQYPNSQGFDGLQDQSAPLNWTTDSTIHDHVGVTMSETPNHVLETTTQPENILLFQCEVCNISCNAKDMLEKHKIGKKHLKNVKKLADSSADAQKMVPPPVASETLVGELENEKHRLIQNGTETLIHCDICNVFCNDQEVFQKHVAGKKHSAKSIIQSAGANAVFDATSDSSCGPQKKPDPFQCEICKITCSSSELLKAHISGKKHLKKMKELGLIPNMPLTPIASLDTPTANPESSEGKTVALHEFKRVCEICGISCDTDEMMKFHTEGKKHRKKLEKSEKLIGPNPAVTTEPAATPMVIGPLQEGVQIVSSEGSKRKNKRGGTDDDVETKKQKIVQGGASSDAVQICNLCNVVCNSRKVFISHLAGQKHAAMAVKQAETQAVPTGQES
ncbi:hypothetical protein L1987_80217 [Smallanthus sonchifolius]|uniref:Uncharacterized protein n=1 Tax=Smallanthus sonchifolius TaxID=185202 RepID=A0ACB8YN62_9ASTR|nr:hypothetical protein L1987_80217 [Smallanthus sonchifolius]